MSQLIARYIRQDPRLPALLAKIRSSGKKTFLLTNSDWWYTSHVMAFLLGPDWTHGFHLVGVDASKPRFFSSGSPLRLVATLEQGFPQVPLACPPPGPLVYSGGDQATYCSLLGVLPHSVLYVGDHLYADVVQCTRSCDWRALLIVPELGRELGVCGAQEGVLEQLGALQRLLESSGGGLQEVKERLARLVETHGRGFGGSGSLFR